MTLPRTGKAIFCDEKWRLEQNGKQKQTNGFYGNSKK